MSQAVIEKPATNSPFHEPTRHFRFTNEGLINVIVDGRRANSYFVPIAKPKNKGSKQLQFDTEWTQDRIEKNKPIRTTPPPRRHVAQGRQIGTEPASAPHAAPRSLCHIWPPRHNTQCAVNPEPR